MLDLVFKSGDRLALPYSYLMAIELDVGGNVTLTYPSRRIDIEGRDLVPLHNALLAHLVRRVTEAGSAFDPGAKNTWIKSIVVTAAASSD